MDERLPERTRRSRTWKEGAVVVLLILLSVAASRAELPGIEGTRDPASVAAVSPPDGRDLARLPGSPSERADHRSDLKRFPYTEESSPEPSLALAPPLVQDRVPDENEGSLAEPLDRIRQTAGPAWWDDAVRQPLRSAEDPKLIGLEQILLSALSHSSQIRVLREIPLIRETTIQEAEAEFDWVSFLESQWIDTSEPVGNRLTTGGPNRFNDEYLSASAGVRKRNQVGGRLEIGQQFGHQQNNSFFFDPPNQGTARLTLSYTQPILRGAGREYNTSLILLAETDTDASRDEVAAQLQLHLLDVARAYWGLYLERGLLLQKRQFYHEAAAVLQKLERRRNIDALQSQILRTCAAVESRRADILRAEMAVRNSESRIRSLVNDPTLGDSQTDELVPQLAPGQDRIELDLTTAVETALRNRPEVAQAVKQIQAAGIRLNMSRNDLLPALNVVLESYVAGLRGSSDVGAAWMDQYREGEPSYSIGLQYERPFGNRAAQARLQRRQHELRQLQAEMQNVLEAIRLEVEVNVREVQTAYGEMVANYRAMEAAAVEVEYLQDRWQLLPDSDRSAALFLDALLQAQERLNLAESAYLRAQLNYNLSQMSFRKAIGVLLQADG